ncbi:bromodomain and extraterminal domain protein 9 [Actinidia rufa]|uniref:Bromodomain and extraterminal domain protein 9 n=1 Tax=Actinidia rufa TaxID=165716 RepID=A0A7J0H7N0_9ERIC|nr:bromodomain and extraterminal domain protein 9 [Actinidia rufa]
MQRTNVVTLSSCSDILSCSNKQNGPAVETIKKSLELISGAEKRANPPGLKAGVWNRGTSGRWKLIEKKLPKSSNSLQEKSRLHEDTERVKSMPPSKKRKITSTQKINPEPVTRIMTNVEKQQLSREMESLQGELPDNIVEFLREHSSNGMETGEDEIEIDIGDLSDDTLFTLRKLLDDFLQEKQRNITKGEPCDIELQNESGLSNSSMQLCKGILGNHPIDEDADIVGNELPISNYPPVEAEPESGFDVSPTATLSCLIPSLELAVERGRNHLKEAARQKTLKDGSASEVFGGLVPSRAEPFHSPILIGRLSEEYCHFVAICWPGVKKCKSTRIQSLPSGTGNWKRDKRLLAHQAYTIGPVGIEVIEGGNGNLLVPDLHVMEEGAFIDFDAWPDCYGPFARTRPKKSKVACYGGKSIGNSESSSSGSELDGTKASSMAKPPNENSGPEVNLDEKTGFVDSLDRNQSVSGLDQLEQVSQKPNCVESDCHQDGESAPNERQVSPQKLYRAAVLKERFADTIWKAREKTINQGEKGDPEKLRREREELEMQKRKEKARLQAEAKAAEDARRQAEAEAAAEAKRKRELEREAAARQALLKMEKTVEINENSRFLEDLEMLSAAPPEQLPSSGDETSPDNSQDGLGSFKFGGSNPLEQLGLYMKADEEEEEGDPPGIPNVVDDVEDGEID